MSKCSTKNVMSVSEMRRFAKLVAKMSKMVEKFIEPSKVSAKKVVTKTVEPKAVATKRVCAISKNNRRRYFSSLSECAKALSIDSGNMSKAINGKRKTAGGYRFEYVG